MQRRLLFTGAALVAAVAALLGGVLGGEPPAGSASGLGSQIAAARLLDGFAAGDTASSVTRLEQRVDVSPEDAEALMLLGLAYQQRARETGDPRFYPRSEDVLERSLALVPRNDLALAGLAALAASRHRFGEARRLSRRALAINPDSGAALGILGDAHVETGRYRRAFAAFDRMAALKPTASAYARISYARELVGRTGGAVAAMKLAVSAAAGAAEPAAWAHTQLGNLHAGRGRLAAADREYRHALVRLPGHAPAQSGLATLALWRGNAAEAARLYDAAVEREPQPEFAVGLGDALARLGEADAAARAYRRAARLERLFAANGGRNELETALFDLDHDRHVGDALSRARAGRNLRPSVEGEHVLAWALFKNGRCRDARSHSLKALRLGTKDWGAMLHRSLIESCLGNEEAARAWRGRALAANRYALAGFGPLAAHRR